MNYYNEIDPFAATWLECLIDKELIAPGYVDRRDIQDVTPNDLAGFTQCHFFSGIGVWSYALRRAGWPDDRPVWTGSCPCQPFSAAGERGGFDDERHLWPAWFHLITQAKPEGVPILGEQVSGKSVGPWIDLVQTDMEGIGHAFGIVDSPSAGYGAPHIRQRINWLAYAERDGFNGSGNAGTGWRFEDSNRCGVGHDAADFGWIGGRPGEACDQSGPIERLERFRHVERVVGNPHDARSQRRRFGWGSTNKRIVRTPSLAGVGQPDADGGNANAEWQQPGGQYGQFAQDSRTRGTVNGFWSNADWIACTDGKARPVEPGTFPLAHGATARVGRLRGYGNAVNAEQTTAFCQAVMGLLGNDA